MAWFLGPRRLYDDLPEPEWLRDDTDAARALRELVSMGRVQNRLVSALELLRMEVLYNAKPGTFQRHPNIKYFPTKDDVDSAAAALDTAAKKVRDVLEPFATVPEVMAVCMHPEVEEREEILALSQITDTLDWLQGGMAHLRALIRRKDGLRDLLKAYITVHAHDFERDRYYDRLVAALIHAATARTQERPYYEWAHQNWRSHHKDLLDRVARNVLAELKEGGYDIAVDDDGTVTKCQPPTKPPTVQVP